MVSYGDAANQPVSLEVDPFRSCAIVDGRIVPLRPLDLSVLDILAREPRRAVSRGVIAEELWGGETVDLRAVDTCISRLRRALNGAGHTIVTVRRIGYRLDVSGS